MRYKVILYNTASAADVDVAGTFSFYTRTSAEDCCLAWAESAAHESWLWDGLSWAKFE